MPSEQSRRLISQDAQSPLFRCVVWRRYLGWWSTWFKGRIHGKDNFAVRISVHYSTVGMSSQGEISVYHIYQGAKLQYPATINCKGFEAFDILHLHTDRFTPVEYPRSNMLPAQKHLQVSRHTVQSLNAPLPSNSRTICVEGIRT